MFVILVLLIIVFLFVYRLNKHNIKGAIGESRVARQLKRLPKNEYKILNDILIRTDKGSSQIDHVVISVYGIFVIETKSYGGWIHGNEKSEDWTQTIYKNRTKFRNPIRQNWGHIYALKDVLSDFKQMKYHPIVVFAGNGILKNITAKTPVIYSQYLFRTIRDKSETPNLSIEQVNNITAKLKEINNQSRKSKKEHVRQVKNHVDEGKRKVRLLICPRCDGDLVIREGQFGKFYGCSNYPKCRYSRPYGRR